MFTDNPTIPARLEVLLDVLHIMRDRKTDREAVRSLLQPPGLSGLTEASRQADEHLSASQQLGLVEVDVSGNFRLAYRVRGEHSPRKAILDAFDRIALGSSETEPWASRFYAFLIVQDQDATNHGAEVQAAVSRAFNNALPPHIDRANPMNSDKFRSLMRWYQYVGLGWIDPGGGFVPDPTVRLMRSMQAIFGKAKTLDAAEAMSRIATACPELDGGSLFLEVTASYYNSADRVCTRALATALRSLHDQQVLRLSCPRDSKGWSLARSGSVLIPGVLDSDRFDRIAFA